MTSTTPGRFCMMLGAPEIELKLIVTASDNTPLKARLVAKMLERLGKTDIPLGIGKQTSENAINQEAWLGNYSLKDYSGKVHQDGVQAIIDLIEASPEPVTLCVIGPQTNIGEALKRKPEIAQKARIVSMAGSVYRGYNGKKEIDPEWNVKKDAAAAQAVFAAPWEIIYAPLDTCGLLQLKGDAYCQVKESKHPFAKLTIENYDAWVNRKHYAVDSSSILYDTLAVYLCYGDAFVEMKTVHLRVDEAGYTRLDEEKGRPVQCALAWNDQAAFDAHLIKTLTTSK